MRDRGAFGWAVRTGRRRDGRAGARSFRLRPGADRPGGGAAGVGARTGSGLASPDGRTARADPSVRDYRTGLLPWVVAANRCSGQVWRIRG